jgi:hypothetical protein
VFAHVLPPGRQSTADDAPARQHPDLATWLVETVAHAAVHEGIVERRADVESGALADELVRLLVRYLKR